MEWIDKIIEIVKLPTKLIVAIFFASITLFFLSDEILTLSKVVGFPKECGSYYYIVIVASVSGWLLLIKAACYLWHFIDSRVSSHKLKKICMKRLEQLDASEKEVLQEFRSQNKNTLPLKKHLPVVAGLINAKILRVIDDQSAVSEYEVGVWSMKISDLAKKNLTYEMLGLRNGKPSEKVFNK